MSTQALQALHTYVSDRVIGQPQLVDRLLIALLAGGHLLVEGAPGLAKTRAIKLLAQGVEGDFQRIQFTPDLLPADLTGSEVFRPQTGEFVFQPGPLFHQMVLADEVNRAPPKVQSALLEAMGEHQITVGQRTYTMPDMFLVMATQNPLEQEGTYPLPEAQLDRFLMHTKISYPEPEDEERILDLVLGELREGRATKTPSAQPCATREDVAEARAGVLDVHMEPSVKQYLLELVLATRHPQRYGDELTRWLQFGASPRATLALDLCSRASAWLHGRDYVTPADVQSLAPDVLRHRLILSFEAGSEEVTVDQCIVLLIERVAAP
ncbi:MAG: MoxR family ATPase [Pseudomonadota bacterium]